LIKQYGWSQHNAGKIAKLGAEANVHGNVLLEYTKWWIRNNNASLKGILPGMEADARKKIEEFVSERNIAALRERFRLRGELVGKTALPLPTMVRVDPYHLGVQTLQMIIDDIFMYAFWGDPWKDQLSPLALTITPTGQIILSQPGGNVEKKALERAQYYFGNRVQVTTDNLTRLSNNEGNIHAEEAAISLLESRVPGSARDAKQVCTWYACDSCKALQQQYGVLNLTGFASDHNNICKRW
jgi:hypothetical protein